jgi:hypothetical protein
MRGEDRRGRKERNLRSGGTVVHRAGDLRSGDDDARA